MAKVRGMYLMSKAPRTVILPCTSTPHRQRQLYGHNLQPKPKLYGFLVLRAQYNEFVESGSKNWAKMNWTMANMDGEDD